MATRIITRLLLLLIALAAATALLVGGLSVLASMAPDSGTLPKPDQAAELRKDIGSSARDAADEAAGATSTPTVVLVFAGVVLMAALPPVHRVYVYGTYHPQRWP
jgi:hypothetical protein